MNLKNKLNQVRTIPKEQFLVKKDFKSILIMTILAILFGFMSKYIDVIPHYDKLADILNILSDISSGLGIWIFIATLIAVWSRTPTLAVIKIFVFFVVMLLTYYIYAAFILGTFLTRYLLLWGSIALISLLFAYFLWFARGTGWIAAIIGAFPIGILLSTGLDFFHTLSITEGLDLLFALLLLVYLPMRQKLQYLRLVIPTVIVYFIFSKLKVISFLMGILYKGIIKN